MALYVSNEEKTISRADIIFDDDSKVAFIMDWREQQDGIVLPRVIRRINGKTTDVFFRDDAKVILISDRAAAEADAAADCYAGVIAQAVNLALSGNAEISGP